MATTMNINGHTATITAALKKQPIFCATHPRACSTAFERVMMTRTDVLVCEHEPFGDAFYYGPERLGARYYDADDAAAQKVRADSGFNRVTFADVAERIGRDATETDKRVFIKDISYYIVPPPTHARVRTAPSLRLGLHKRKGYGTSSPSSLSSGVSYNNDVNGNGGDNDISNGNRHDILPTTAAWESPANVAVEDLETENPTVLPLSYLRQFQWTFLIRHPRRAIPSYYRCCAPPLSELTGFDYFSPEEAGYRELRALFDYLRACRIVGEDVFVLDADDLLDAPKIAIRKYCEHVGLDYSDKMLEWGEGGCEAFEKWKGFHEDAINSTALRPRVSKAEKTEAQEYAEWTDKYGVDGADIIRKAVAENLADYEYLKQFKVKLGV